VGEAVSYGIVLQTPYRHLCGFTEENPGKPQSG